MDLLISCLVWLISGIQLFIVTGDFNLPDLRDVQKGKLSEMFHNFMIGEGLNQLVNEPTHVSGNTLDLVLTIDDIVSDLEVRAGISTSDHFVLHFKVRLSSSSNNEVSQPCYYKCEDVFVFLHNLNWDLLFEFCQTADEYWEQFREVLIYCIHEILPKRKISKRNFGFPLSNATELLLDEKDRVFKRFKKSKSHFRKMILKTHYNRLSRKCKVLVKQDKIWYEKSFVENGSDIKRFFKHVKRTLRRPENVPDILCASGQIAIEPVAKCEEFNRHFSSVFSLDNGEIAPFPPRTAQSLNDIVFSEVLVLKFMKKLKNSFATGSDGIPAIFLKNIADYIYGPMTTLFNVIFQLGQYPKQWLEAEVTPIFKGKGKNTLAENYRPISLTSVVGKVMESCVKHFMLGHLTDNDLLSPHQHGFISGKSTVTELLECQLRWLECLDKSQVVDVVYIDFAKAFDSVVHSKLLRKCEQYGFKGKVFTFLKNFLSERKQRVKIDGSVSSFSPVLSGVPQGSVLGPLLFLIYVNDLPECLNACEMKLYADDSKLFTSVSKIENFSVELQADLNEVVQWCHTWQLKINAGKCAVLPIGFRRELSNLTYNMENTDLDFCDWQKDLGVTITSNLSSSKHIQNIVSSASRVMGLLFRTFECRDKVFMVRMFCTKVRPILEYACESWSPYNLCDIDAIEQVQRSFTKRISGLKNLPYGERLELCGLEPLELRRLKRDLTLVFRIISKEVNLNFDDFFTFSPYASTRGHSKKLYPRKSKTNRFLGFFSLRVINFWNKLPESVINSPNTSIFKSRLNKLDDLKRTLSGRALRNYYL